MSTITHTNQPRKKILIFSEDIDFCRSLTLLFQSKYDVLSTTVIEETFDLVGKEKVDLILADSAISDERILSAIKKIKNVRTEIIIILLYVYNFSNIELEKNYREFVDGLFYKPVDIYQVMSVIKDLLKEKYS